MTRLLPGISLLALLVSGAPGFALDVRQATQMQRQVRSCMLKRMTAEKTLSYNDAKRMCADELKAQSNTQSNALAAPAPSAIRQGG